MPTERAAIATETRTRTPRRVCFVVRGVWQEGELVEAGCTWRIVRADGSGHRMLLPASDVRDGVTAGADGNGGARPEEG